MRLSRIAIIFQSASICTTSLAARYVRHINEAYKVFNCDIELEQEEYSRIYHEKILDSATIGTLSEELNDLVGNTRDTRNVQFYDQDNGDYEYILLSTKSHSMTILCIP
ncbi:putative secreted effector protein [Blumeria graminis f. sp. tritici 96224]|uniref:Putative secreted effector protein n=1 Tax=Blumeria graminis f. sp. tritici 96224 TaxID=1268274 RepID=A0A656KMS1_BLUGR|nr:putative secreted effector protein [Blumeria graminis f. sp. tritici 96224]